MIRLKNRVFRFYKRHSFGITIAIVCVLSGTFILSGIMQAPEIKKNRQDTIEAKAMTEDERERQAEIDHLKTYEVNTDEYIERIAAEKLGLVKSNATIFYDISEDR